MNPNVRIFKFFGLIFFALVTFSACKTDSYVKSSEILNLTDWTLPDTAKVNADFDVYVSTKTTSSCEKDVKFLINQIAENAYKVLGTATYESYNSECNEKIVEIDTTLYGNISKVGRYYFLFFKEDIWNVDSIQVVP